MIKPQTPLSVLLLRFSTVCSPDVPLPLRMLRESMELTPENYQQAQEELISTGTWMEIPGVGVLLPVMVWAQYHNQVSAAQTRRILTVTLRQAQEAMAHHSRLAQLSAIRELGPHLLHFAQQAEKMALPESTGLWQVLGTYLQAVGKSAEAIDCFQHALKSQCTPGAAESQIELYQQMGEAYQSQQAYPQAEQAFQIACGLCAEAYSPADARIAPLLEHLGQIAFLQNDYPTAIYFYQQTLAIDEAAQSGANRIASRWNNLGRVHQAAGDLLNATNCFKKASDLWRNTGTSEHHANQALALKNLGIVYQQMGQLTQARNHLETAIQVSENLYGKDHPDIGRDASLLAGILQEMGHFDEARELFHRALQIDIRSFGKLHPEVALTYNNLGVLLAQMGDVNDAQNAFQESLNILKRCAAPDHPYRQQAEENLQGLQSASNSIQ